jgi:hypothetical protein
MCVLTKIHIHKNQTGTGSPTKTEGTNHDLNKRTTLLIKEAERITDLLAVDTVQAKLDWIALLYQYQQLRATGETIPNMDEPTTELPNQPTNAGVIQPTIIMDEKTGKEKPNLQIQITHHGDRAVSHTPDTTGTLATTLSPIIPPYISTAPTNPALIHVDPNLLLEFVLQWQQQQKDTTTATIEQKPMLPIKERLGPMTPPPPYTEANIKTESEPGSRCVETRPHGLKDRPRPRDNRRAHPYRMDRPRPADPRRWTPTRSQTFNQNRGRERPQPSTHHRPACTRQHEDRRKEDGCKRRSSTPSSSEKGSS